MTRADRPKTAEETQVVVLMGGLGTRLGPAHAHTPKSLASVNGRPFFSYQLELMQAAGFKNFLFLVGHCGDQIEAAFGGGEDRGVRIAYSRDGERLLGTGGAIARALPLLDESFVLLYGDSFLDIDYDEVLYRFWRGQKQGCEALMAVLENGGRFDRSNILLEDGVLRLYDKKNPLPAMRHIDYGVGVYERAVFARERREAFDLSDVQNALSRAGKLAHCEVTNRFYEIGSPETLAAFCAYAAARFDRPNRAVFLDRDGVLNELWWNDDIEQLDAPLSPERLKLIDGAAETVQMLRDKGYRAFVVTNQPAAAKGKTTLERLYDVRLAFVKRMRALGAEFDGVLLCPHYPEPQALTRETFLARRCSCRKPAPGLILRAAQTHNLDLARSVTAGDSHTDVLAGRAAGTKTAFIGGLKCDACHLLGGYRPDYTAASALELAKML